MIRLQKRDMELIETLNTLKVLTSSQIQRLFFDNLQPAQSRRCKQLVNHKHIKCCNQGVWQENLYYIKKKPTQQLKSMLLLSEFYVLLKENNVNINYFQREYIIPHTNIRCDAYMIFERDDFEYEIIIEVDLTHWDGWKYEKELMKGTKFPPLIYISPCKRKYNENLEAYYIKKDFSNFKDILTLF